MLVLEAWNKATQLRSENDKSQLAHPRPPPPGPCRQFSLCLGRAITQQYKDYLGFLVSILIMNFCLGWFIAEQTKTTNPEVLGRFPEGACSCISSLLPHTHMREGTHSHIHTLIEICNQQIYGFWGACNKVAIGNYPSTTMYFPFISIASCSATAEATFGPEKTIYWRESSAGVTS